MSSRASFDLLRFGCGLDCCLAGIHADQNPAAQNTAALDAKSAAATQERTKQRPGKEQQGDATLLGERLLVSFNPAEQQLVAEDGGGFRGSDQPRFPRRAAWLQERFDQRAWNRNDPRRQRGPDPKTVDKILRGEAVREDVLEKLANALSRKHAKVQLLDIPKD